MRIVTGTDYKLPLKEFYASRRRLIQQNWVLRRSKLIVTTCSEMQTGRAGQTSRAGWAGRTGREILRLLSGNELNCPPISGHPSSASLAHFLQTVLPSQRFLRMPLFYESSLQRMVGRQLCNKASWTEKTADVSCYSHYLKNNFFYSAQLFSLPLPCYSVVSPVC